MKLDWLFSCGMRHLAVVQAAPNPLLQQREELAVNRTNAQVYQGFLD